MHILLATDASPEALQAVRLGVLLQSSLDAEITLLSVTPDEDQAERARLHINQLVERHASLRQASSVIRHGHAAAQILEEAERGIYDLLIIGRRGQSRVARFLLGDTALRLAQECRLPLIIVQQSPVHLRKVLVCTAGGKGGRIDADYAARIAAAMKAELTILHVMSQIDITPGDQWDTAAHPATWHIEHRTPEGSHLQELLEIAESHGISATPVIRYGLVVEQILAEAREHGFDLLVIGAHSGEGLTRFLLDNVTEAILTNARRPVLVIRPAPSTQSRA